MSSNTRQKKFQLSNCIGREIIKRYVRWYPLEQCINFLLAMSKVTTITTIFCCNLQTRNFLLIFDTKESHFQPINSKDPNHCKNLQLLNNYHIWLGYAKTTSNLFRLRNAKIVFGIFQDHNFQYLLNAWPCFKVQNIPKRPNFCKGREQGGSKFN